MLLSTGEMTAPYAKQTIMQSKSLKLADFQDLQFRINYKIDILLPTLLTQFMQCHMLTMTLTKSM
jgi:hypothetical protein